MSYTMCLLRQQVCARWNHYNSLKKNNPGNAPFSSVKTEKQTPITAAQLDMSGELLH